VPNGIAVKLMSPPSVAALSFPTEESDPSDLRW
jgi:hypothetical protein